MQMVKDLQNGVKGLFIAEELTKIAKTLLELNIEMGKKQKEALTVILSVHEESLLAINYARVVVMKLRNICKDLLLVLEIESSKSILESAIDVYLAEGKLMEGDVQKAVDKLTRASAKAVSGELV